VDQIRREAPRRALLMCPLTLKCHHLNIQHQILKAAGTEEANGYIAQIEAA